MSITLLAWLYYLVSLSSAVLAFQPLLLPSSAVKKWTPLQSHRAGQNHSPMNVGANNNYSTSEGKGLAYYSVMTLDILCHIQFTIQQE